MEKKTFLVRIDEKTLEDFNEILERESVNRSALFRKWIKDYIDNNELKEEE